LIAHLFDGVRMVNLIGDGKASVTEEDLGRLKSLFHVYLFDILGLKEENARGANSETLTQLVELTLQLRVKAKNNKDWNTSDYIRNELARIGISVKDTKEGYEWEME
jgi:cysteinyl-tRNA synthetase